MSNFVNVVVASGLFTFDSEGHFDRDEKCDGWVGFGRKKTRCEFGKHTMQRWLLFGNLRLDVVIIHLRSAESIPPALVRLLHRRDLVIISSDPTSDIVKLEQFGFYVPEAERPLPLELSEITRSLYNRVGFKNIEGNPWWQNRPDKPEFLTGMGFASYLISGLSYKPTRAKGQDAAHHDWYVRRFGSPPQP